MGLTSQLAEIMEFLNAQELANLRLPELPKTKKGVILMANREHWQSRPRTARGGGMEYCIATLPEPIRQAVQAKHAAELLAQTAVNIEPVPQTAVSRTNPKGKKLMHRHNSSQLALPFDEVKGLNDKQKACAHARMAIVGDVLNIARSWEISQKKAAAYFLEQLEQGTLPSALAEVVPVANARSDGKKHMGMRSLMGWIAAYRAASDANARLMALAPKPTKLETPLQAYWWLGDFMRFYSLPTKPALKHAYETFADWWLKENKPLNDLPSLHQVRRVWHKLPKTIQERGRKTGAAYKALLPYVDRDWDVLEPNDVWIGDGHSFKAKIACPSSGRPYVPEVTVVIDGCTRKVMGFSVSLAENRKAVADALRIGMKYHGLPLIYYSDNGAGQTAQTIDHPILGLCARLGICHMTGKPGNPQGRGIIERWWQNTLIRQARTYATFTGTGMDETTQHRIQRKLVSAVNAERNGKELTDEQRQYRESYPVLRHFLRIWCKP